MRIEKFSFGHITIDGVTYEHDVVIDRGKIRKTSEEAVEETARCLYPYAAVGG